MTNTIKVIFRPDENVLLRYGRAGTAFFSNLVASKGFELGSRFDNRSRAVFGEKVNPAFGPDW